MLRLTRHLFAWQPDGALFDYYERAHFNHILAQQHPVDRHVHLHDAADVGRGTRVLDAHGSFWCCVGSGMESHAKHGESICWEGDGTLLVNLYIPSRSAVARARRAAPA